MSREIKFRAWVTALGVPFMAIQGTPALETLQSFIFHYGSEKNLMQFTGLVDKNGKEIYEGDILNFGGKTNTTVIFDNGAFNAFNEPLGWDFDYPNYPAMDDLKYCEIIGNLHENPEILN